MIASAAEVDNMGFVGVYAAKPHEQAASEASLAAAYSELAYSDDLEKVMIAANVVLRTSGLEVDNIDLTDKDGHKEASERHSDNAEKLMHHAMRIGSWAETLQGNATLPEIEKLKDYGKFLGFDIEGIENRPEDMVMLEDEVESEGKDMDALAYKKESVELGIDLGEVMSIDVTSAVKKLKPKKGESITINDLLETQKAIDGKEYDSKYPRFKLKKDIVAALKTGELSADLRDTIAEIEKKKIQAHASNNVAALMPVSDLFKQKSIRDILWENGIYTCDQLTKMRSIEFLNYPKIGHVAFEVVNRELVANGLSFKQHGN